MTDGYLLDSNICIYGLRGDRPLLAERFIASPRGSLFVSTISLAEVAVGYGGNIDDAPELAEFLRVVKPLPFTERAARIYGTLPFRRRGFDRLIAAHALGEGLTLVTNNVRDFADIPGLVVEDWTLPPEPRA